MIFEYFVFKALAGAVLGYGAATTVSKYTTGRHLHQHALDAWCDLRQEVLQWRRLNSSRPIAKIVGKVAHVLDSAFIAAHRLVTFRILAVDEQGQVETISSRQMPVEELLARHPELAHRRKVALELMD